MRICTRKLNPRINKQILICDDKQQTKKNRCFPTFLAKADVKVGSHKKNDAILKRDSSDESHEGESCHRISAAPVLLGFTCEIAAFVRSMVSESAGEVLSPEFWHLSPSIRHLRHKVHSQYSPCV